MEARREAQNRCRLRAVGGADGDETPSIGILDSQGIRNETLWLFVHTFPHHPRWSRSAVLAVNRSLTITLVRRTCVAR